MTEIEFHRFANAFPLMEGEPFAELVDDIRANGLRQPIIMHEGQILDGRNRYRACREAGVEPRFEDFPADADAIAFVVSTNLRRRHLTDEQRRHIAADLATMPHGGERGNQYTGGKPPTGSMTTAKAAEMMQVPERSVERAKQVKRTDPEAHEAAKAGKPKPKRTVMPPPPPGVGGENTYRAALRAIEANVGSETVVKIRQGKIKLATYEVKRIAELPAEQQAAAIERASGVHVGILAPDPELSAPSPSPSRRARLC